MKKVLKAFILAVMMLVVSAVAQAEGVSVNDYSYDADERIMLHAIGDTLDTRSFTYVGATNSTADFNATATDVSYTIGNIMYQAAISDPVDLSAQGAFTAQAASTKAYYVFHFDEDGDFGVTAGATVAATSDPAWPELLDTVAPFAAVLVETDGTHAFTLGTTAFGTGNTATWINLSADPGKALND